MVFDRQKTSYQVKTADFEGPLDLLLSLIEKRKFFINDISLAKVADDYLETIKKLEKFPMEDVASFLLIASTLVLLKSKSLLPALSLTDEEEGNIEDLEYRLRIYQKMKDLAAELEKRYGQHSIYAPKSGKITAVAFVPDAETNLSEIFAAVNRVLQNVPKEEKLPKAEVKKIIRLEDVMDRLAERISRTLKMSFRDFSKKETAEKAEIIVSFIAMLELVKMGVISVTQQQLFEDIDMEAEELGVPNYDHL
ncbi:MAG TPA: segregation/condensation protein A [Candidatus Paceibacterota bacterium]|nr:segregation/condensation protein A [Candidatus Paceibacterota bacterium]